MGSRKERITNFKDELLLRPFDVTKFGSDNDPCFGKKYDLSADECQECGDIELCAIAFSHKQTLLRLKKEEKFPMKDLEEVPFIQKEQIRLFYKDARKTHDKTTAKILTKRRFNVTITDINQIIKNGRKRH